MADMNRSRPDYGLDAPGVVRNLFLIAIALLLPSLTQLTGVWSGRVHNIPVATILDIYSLGFVALGFYMIYSSRVGKLRERDRLLNLIDWTGSESVLDIGCGRGLMLIGAARRLTTGKAVGIDLWQQEDQSGNRPDATLQNATIEGVADRVEIKTADMRILPFEDASFDVILSHWAIHNLYDPADRATALKEIVRVIKPGGTVVLADIAHSGEYARHFQSRGFAPRRIRYGILGTILGVLTCGRFHPSAVIARGA